MTAVKRGPWLIVQDLSDGHSYLLGSVPPALHAEEAMMLWSGKSATKQWPTARAVLAIKAKTTRPRKHDAEEDHEAD